MIKKKEYQDNYKSYKLNDYERIFRLYSDVKYSKEINHNFSISIIKDESLLKRLKCRKLKIVNDNLGNIRYIILTDDYYQTYLKTIEEGLYNFSIIQDANTDLNKRAIREKIIEFELNKNCIRSSQICDIVYILLTQKKYLSNLVQSDCISVYFEVAMRFYVNNLANYKSLFYSVYLGNEEWSAKQDLKPPSKILNEKHEHYGDFYRDRIKCFLQV